MKDQNPNNAIDDHVETILMSYMLATDLNIMDRDAHYNRCWYALWSTINKQKVDQVKAICSKKNSNDERWTQVCLMVFDEYYSKSSKPSLSNRFSKNKFHQISIYEFIVILL